MRGRLGWWLVLATLAVAPVAAQSSRAPQSDRAHVLKAAAGIMRKAGFCALITNGEDGQPQSRIVQPLPPDDAFTVWIGTNPVTRKVTQVQKDPRVTLSYFDPAGPGYVTLIGRAVIVRDAAERAKHWTDAWNTFYKDKYRGDDFVLLKVTPLRLEVVSYADGITNDPKTWKPVTVEMQKK